MVKEKKPLKGKIPSRRKFFKTAAATGAAATAAVAMPNLALGGGHTTLKMQAAWPSGANIFFEMAGDYAKMVDQMSGGTLKIDLQPVGAVVKTSEIGQAVSSGVLDMGHWVTAYWYGKTLQLHYLEQDHHTVCHHKKLWDGWNMVEEELYMKKL